MQLKSFNKLSTKDPVCIQITTRTPIRKQSEKSELKRLFQETLCDNKVNIIDCAYETISLELESEYGNVLNCHQNIYICFDKWIQREEYVNTNDCGVSYTNYMNEMCECFANGGVLDGEYFLPNNSSIIDTSDWQISYYDSIDSVDYLLQR